MAGKRFVVVGAGVGGLAIALRLAHRGNAVTVLEKGSAVGGRSQLETVGDCRFDSGPTLLMMLDPFRKLFADVGESLDAHLQIRRLDPGYRVFYADGARLEASPDLETMTRNLVALSGEDEARKYPGFLAELKRLYEESIPNFVRKNYRSVWDFASPSQLRRVVKHHMLSNLSKRVAKRFADPKLRMLFSFQTMYLGLSPKDAPWVYATLAYMEYGEGIWYPDGGLSRISEAIAELASNRGADIRLNTAATRVMAGVVELESGERIEADVVIANADMPYAERELSRTAATRKLRYSCSAHLLYIDYEGSLEGLAHHNVLFGSDFESNLDAIFANLREPVDPAFYACVSSRTDPNAAPEGHENLLLLVPIPNLDCPLDDAAIGRIENSVFSRLEREVGFKRDRIRGVRRRGPREWQSELNLDRGAAFGISHDLFQSAFMRPQNRSRSNPDLFFVGASTVPGNGLPMVLISAELVEQRLVREGLIPA